MRRMHLSILVTTSLLVSACSNITHEEADGAAGAVMGALVGSLFGQGAGKATAIAVGGLVGGLAGTSYGRELDEADRRRARRAALTAANAETGDRIIWSSEEDPAVTGYAVPIGPAEVEDGALCKDVRSVYMLEGEELTETERFCLRDGRWETL